MSDPTVSTGSGPLPPPPGASLASRPRRSRWGVVAAVCIGLPILEIVLLILLGRAIGVEWTLLLLVAEAALGAYLLNREGRRAWHAVRDAVVAGVPPTGELADAALIFIGGIFLILPGLLTDLIGLLCLIPGTRRLMRALIFKALGIKTRPQPGSIQRRPSGAGATLDGEVVEGTVEDATGYRPPLGR